MFFNQQAKVKKQQVGPNPPQQGIDFAHYSNLEEAESKIVYKDKWPIPLYSSTFITNRTEKNSKSGLTEEIRNQLFFGASCPSFFIKNEEPIEYDLNVCKFEQMDVKDALFTYDFILKHLFKDNSPD